MLSWIPIGVLAPELSRGHAARAVKELAPDISGSAYYIRIMPGREEADEGERSTLPKLSQDRCASGPNMCRLVGFSALSE